MKLKDEELPFPEEFLFFELFYLIIKKDILLNNYNNTIIDIVCELGFQSILFNKYIGVDKLINKFYNFNNDVFINDNFLNININLKDKTCISCMSLEYYDNEIDTIKCIEKLNKSKIIYFKGEKKYLKYFNKKNIKILEQNIYKFY